MWMGGSGARLGSALASPSEGVLLSALEENPPRHSSPSWGFDRFHSSCRALWRGAVCNN